MKVSRAYFEEFKKEFVGWQEKLGLTQYEIYFHHETTDDCVAQIRVREIQKIADVYLANSMSRANIVQGPESHAKHEAIHLLLHRMKWLGETRYIENNDLLEEWEAIVRRLEKVL